MNTSPSALTEALRWRYAVKKFDASRKVPAEVWSALEQSLVQAPSSFGLQPWKFIVITNQQIKDQLPAISWNQTQPKDCSHMVVLAGRKTMAADDVERYVKRIIEVRDIPGDPMRGYKDMMLGMVNSMPAPDLDNWAAKQVYIALGFLMESCALLGIDACPMEGIVAPEYDKLLKLPEMGYTAVVGCAVGYRAADDKYAAYPKVRFTTDDVIVRV
ncbi:MAG: NAD(P)H-dependent oxidoreductase [Phycisphaerales bacterium]